MTKQETIRKRRADQVRERLTAALTASAVALGTVRKVRRAEFSTEDRKLGRRDLTPLGDCSCAFDLEMVP